MSPGRTIALHLDRSVEVVATRIRARRPEREHEGRPALADRPPADPCGAVRSLWFDTAMSADGAQLAALTALADAQHVVFGSDFPLQGDAYALANAAGHRAAALADPPAHCAAGTRV